jgi:hypothetical protein
MVTKLTVVIIVDITAINFIQNFIQYPSVKVELLEIISVGFNVTDQPLMRYVAFARYWRKNVNIVRQYISYSWTSRMHMIQLGGIYCMIFS